MTKEVLKQALECAERCESIDGIDWSDVVDAIKEALAQPEQEPVAFQNKSLYSELISAEDWENIDPVWYWMYRPLYTSPPERDWLPEHKCGLHLSHNEHRDVYETVEEFYEEEWFISPEEWNKAIEEDSVWVLHWYPITPIGFIRIAASTLEAIEAKLKEKNT